MAWSPDSKRIAFSAKRDGDDANQIYILDIVGGGEALRATTISTGARLPKFSPDGSKLAFTSDVPPESRNDEDSKRIAAEEKARKYKVRAYDSFPIRNWDTWLPENRQPHAFVQTIDVNDAREDGSRVVVAIFSVFSKITLKGLRKSCDTIASTSLPRSFPD